MLSWILKLSENCLDDYHIPHQALRRWPGWNLKQSSCKLVSSEQLFQASMLVTAPVQFCLSPTSVCPIALRFTNLYSQHIIYEIKFKFLGKHSRTLPSRTTNPPLQSPASISLFSSSTPCPWEFATLQQPRVWCQVLQKSHVSTLLCLFPCCLLPSDASRTCG